MKEKIYIDFGFAEHVQHCLTLVLQPQQLLDVDHDLLHLHPHEPGGDLEHAALLQGQEDELNILELIVWETFNLLQNSLLTQLRGRVLESCLEPIRD